MSDRLTLIYTMIQTVLASAISTTIECHGMVNAGSPGTELS